MRAIFIFPLFFPVFPQPMDDTLDLRLLPMVFYVSMYPFSLLSHASLCHKTPYDTLHFYDSHTFRHVTSSYCAQSACSHAIVFLKEMNSYTGFSSRLISDSL